MDERRNQPNGTQRRDQLLPHQRCTGPDLAGASAGPSPRPPLTRPRRTQQRAGDLLYIALYIAAGSVASYGAAMHDANLVALGGLVVLAMFAFSVVHGVSASMFGYARPHPFRTTHGGDPHDRYHQRAH